jgi:hypothetical protein
MPSATLRRRPVKTPLSRKIATGCLALGIAAAGSSVIIAMIERQSNPKPEPEVSSVSLIGREKQISVIVSTPNADTCRRYELNETTHARSDKGNVDCMGNFGPPGTGQGARIEEISKGFRNH